MAREEIIKVSDDGGCESKCELVHLIYVVVMFIVLLVNNLCYVCLRRCGVCRNGYTATSVLMNSLAGALSGPGGNVNFTLRSLEDNRDEQDDGLSIAPIPLPSREIRALGSMV